MSRPSARRQASANEGQPRPAVESKFVEERRKLKERQREARAKAREDLATVFGLGLPDGCILPGVKRRSEREIYSAEAGELLGCRVDYAKKLLLELERSGILVSEIVWPKDGTSGLGRRYYRLRASR